MRDIEARLRATLQSRLAEIHARQQLPEHIRRRAARGRVIVMATAAAVTVLAVSAGAVGTRWLVRQDKIDEDITVAPPRAAGSWQPLGPPLFQPVPGGSSGFVRVGVMLSWEGPIEGARPTECEVEVLGDAGVVGTATEKVPPPEEELPGGATEGHELSVRVKVPENDMGVDSTIQCAPAEADQESTESASEKFGRFAVSVDAPSRFVTSKGGESASLVRGIVEINATKGTACLTLSGLRFSRASITRSGSHAIGPFTQADNQGGDMCIGPVDAQVLSDVLEQPGAYLLTVDLAPGEATESPLETLGN